MKNIVPTAAPSEAKKEKKEKEKKTEAAPVEAWVNPTPAGEKKGQFGVQ